MIRVVVVVAAAWIGAVQAIRSAAVEARAGRAPAAAARVWASHPDVELTLGLTAIGQATYQRRPIESAVLANIYDTSRKAPLAPEMFLVRGVQAQMAGNSELAHRAFDAAKWRDPRSLPARYFLADRYLRAGDARNGLVQVAVLARLVPAAVGELAPYVATYARDEANWPQLRALFRANSDLKIAALTALAQDAGNAGTVLALTDPADRSPSSAWLEQLVSTLTAAGDYRRARQVWAGMSAVGGSDSLLFDPDFRRSEPPPPFNWTLTSSTIGLAERRPGGGLNVIFYGTEAGPLASQLVLLPAGTYRLSAPVTGGQASAAPLEWQLICAGSNATIATFGLDAAARGGTFSVRADCPAQRLELVGRLSEVARQADIKIARVELTRADPNG